MSARGGGGSKKKASSGTLNLGTRKKTGVKGQLLPFLAATTSGEGRKGARKKEAAKAKPARKSVDDM